MEVIIVGYIITLIIITKVQSQVLKRKSENMKDILKEKNAIDKKLDMK